MESLEVKNNSQICLFVLFYLVDMKEMLIKRLEGGAFPSRNQASLT